MRTLTCPRDQLPLTDLKCSAGHEYASYEGIPVLLRDDVPETLWLISHSIKQAKGEIPVPDVQDARLSIPSTNGYLYTSPMTEYPIPEFPLSGPGRLLDIGCGWGRWTIAAAQQGFDVVAIDPSLGFLLTARKLCEELGLKAEFVCADARYLPFPANSFDQCFSFSVIQHFSKPDALQTMAEMKRVGSKSLVQFAGQYGVRSLYHQAKRRFHEPENFEVRYWSKKELEGLGTVKTQGFFGTGVLKCDVKYLPLKYKPIPYISNMLSKLRVFDTVADSYWVST